MKMKTDDQAQSPDTDISRRDVLKATAALAVTAALPSIAVAAKANGTAPAKANGSVSRPNILYIMVDEMRFPSVFPAGIKTPGEFLQKFMPNTYKLWSKGVKFANHFSAANDCTPSRGVLLTGLYSHQSWCVNTLVLDPGANIANSPPLHPDLPTYGKLLKKAGYLTPYIGKWHVSVPHTGEKAPQYSLYGFDGLISPDPIAQNLQGTYGDVAAEQWSDTYIADKAVEWLQQAPTDQPWCLTVGFQNPHDKQFFPAGTEFQTWTNLFANPVYNPTGLQQKIDWSTTVCAQDVDWATNALANPPSYGYPELPPNWETLAQIQANKPAFQTVWNNINSMIWGGVSFDPNATDFSIQNYPATPGQPPNVHGLGMAPFRYWQRSLDSYTQLMEVLDVNIGQVLDALPADVAQNTVIVFTSDHGEYAGAHGLVSGKSGSFYNECAKVPLIVVDPSGRFTDETDIIRTGITSAVDIVPMLVTLGHNGSRSWLKQPDMAQLYGKRHNLLPMLRAARKPGRRAAFFATDETIPSDVNFLLSPFHIIGMVTEAGKVVVYSHWHLGTTLLSKVDQQLEYYDYSTELGRLEIESLPDSPAAKAMSKRLLKKYLHDELEAPLPRRYRPAQRKTHREVIAFLTLNEKTFTASGT